MKEPNKFRIYETEKITRKASDAAEYTYRVVRFFHQRSYCMTHLMLFTERPPIYASSCMTILGERTKQHVIGLENWLQSIRIRRCSFNILTEFN